jgi:hypothetical protein
MKAYKHHALVVMNVLSFIAKIKGGIVIAPFLSLLGVPIVYLTFVVAFIIAVIFILVPDLTRLPPSPPHCDVVEPCPVQDILGCQDGALSLHQ